MKEEQESRLKAFIEAGKKQGTLRKSIESLLSKILSMLIHFFFSYDILSL
jgi:hypothetical protein